MTDAARLAAAFDGAGLLDDLDRRPATAAEAYVLQDAVRGAIGRPVAAWKLAQTTPAAQAAAGIEAPTVAPLFDGMIVESGTRFPDGAFYFPAVEAEIVIDLRDALPERASVDMVRAAAAGFRLGIEVGDTRFRDKAAVGVLATIADMNAIGALVVGPLLPLERLDEAMAAPVSATLGDGTAVAAVGPAMKPDPLAMVAFLSAFLADRGEALGAGTLVTTGTHTVPTVSPPGRITATFDGVGTVEAILGAPR